MNWEEYQTRTHATAIYPEALAPHYLFPKLLDEALEASEKLDNRSLIIEVLHENADMLWYSSEIIGYLNTVQPVIVIEPNDEGRTWKIMQYAWQTLHIWLKCLRDNDGIIGDIALLEIVKNLGLMLGGIQNLCKTSGVISFDDLLQWNLDKLADRQARGVLGGSGDSR